MLPPEQSPAGRISAPYTPYLCHAPKQPSSLIIRLHLSALPAVKIRYLCLFRGLCEVIKIG